MGVRAHNPRPAVERVFGSIAKFSEGYPIALRVTITGVRGFYVQG